MVHACGENQRHAHGEYIHTHEHRTWKDIEKILDGAGLKPGVLELSKKIFRIVSAAEGKVHGRPAEKVHFHEVGAVDSIVDIMSAAYLIESLKIDRAVVSELHEGSGQVR